MIVAATGHRPNDIKESHQEVETKVRNKLRAAKATRLICGMAEGFDLIAARAAMDLGIPITAARPWNTHKVGELWKEDYAKVLEYADVVHVVVERDTYHVSYLHKRNEWMVDNADAVMAYWNGKEAGGTFACRKYAKKVGKPVANIIKDPPF